MICMFNFSCPFTYLLCLLLNSCYGNDVFWRHSMLVKQSTSFCRKNWTFSPDLCSPNTPVDYRIGGLMQERASATPATDQILEVAPHWHTGKHITKRHRRSSWSVEKAVTCKHEGKMTSLWTSAKTETSSFQSLHTTQPALFRATDSLPRNTRCYASFPSQIFKSK